MHIHIKPLKLFRMIKVDKERALSIQCEIRMLRWSGNMQNRGSLSLKQISERRVLSFIELMVLQLHNLDPSLLLEELGFFGKGRKVGFIIFI